MYKILWIDDQYEGLSELMERCEVIEGFEITKCRFAVEGMKEYEKHLEQWSAVVLDAKVLMASLDEVPNLEGLRYCRDRINELRTKHYVPMFVFTGQPDLISSEMFELMVEKFYSKGDDDDQLIADIKEAADKLEDTQIKFKYQSVFKLWPSDIMQHDLLRVLKVLETEDWANNSVLNDIRKILSNIFAELYDRGYCSVEHDGSNIGACSRDMAQPYKSKFVPNYIQRYLHSIVDITNDGSHRLKVDRDVAKMTAPYLTRSLIYELLTVLEWFATLPDKSQCENVRQIIEAARREYEQKKRQ